MKLSLFLSKRNLWKTYLFKLEKNETIFNCKLIKPLKVIGSNAIRTNKEYYHTCADPFLFVEKDHLYIFYESKTDFSKGSINVQRFDGQNWFDLGCVVQEKFHLSYPQIFRYKNKIYMIPETEENGRLWLYESNNFPNNWFQRKILINEKLVDTNILIKEEGIYLIGSNKDYGLSVYFSKELLENFLCIYKEDKNDLSTSRNAGSIIKENNKYFRIFQDNRSFYGEKIGLSEILQINEINYSEIIINKEFFNQRIFIENIIGHHHISSIRYKDSQYLAIDILSKDILLNTFMYGIIKFIYLFERFKWNFLKLNLMIIKKMMKKY
jgi:hypothetical protein